MLITEDYKQQNAVLHENPSYGISGVRWAETIRQISDAMETRDILDYGCGKRLLERSLGFPIQNYDPAIPGLDARPQRARIVVCTDVLEHVEPDCIEDVLDDIKELTKKAAFFAISKRPAGKTLPDGRNAHLIQKGCEWWLPKLWTRFKLIQFNEIGSDFIVIVRSRGLG